jgi:thiamine kinase-like enzyme
MAEQLILSPGRELASTIDQGADYLAWLNHRIQRLTGLPVPIVAAHNDLTMANVLGDANGIRSVVDWEGATADGLPLADLHYAVCDAATMVNGGDRLAAFRACFIEETELRECLLQCEAEVRAFMDGPPQWIELCGHATWLQHAANEKARPSLQSDRAFVAIANLLAAGVMD